MAQIGGSFTRSEYSSITVGRSAVRYLTTVMTDGLPYWGEGEIHMAGLKRMVALQSSIGAITGTVDLDKMIDTEFLPDDLKTIK